MKKKSKKANKELKQAILDIQQQYNIKTSGFTKAYSIAKTGLLNETNSARLKIDLVGGSKAYLSKSGKLFATIGDNPGELITSAVISNFADILQSIIKYDFLGINLNESECILLLQEALSYSAIDCFELLIKQNKFLSHINGRNSNGTGIVYIAATSQCKLKALSLLKKAGADFNTLNVNGISAFQKLVFDADFTAATFLLSLGADINQITPNNGFTALYHACTHNKHDAIKFLLNKGADTSIKANDGASLLLIAAEYGNDDLIQKLITTYGSDINAVSKYGETPLHGATFNGHINTIKLLLGLGADASIQNQLGYSPLQLAIQSGQTLEIIDILLDNSREPILIDSFKFLFISKLDDILELISDKVNDLLTTNNFTQALEVVLEKILWANKYPSDNEYKGVFEFLLQNKITYAQLKHINFGLDVCAKIGLVTSLTQMLENGVNLDYLYEGGSTALNISIASRNESFAASLIQNNANVDLADEQGVTSAHLAASLGMITVLSDIINKSPILLTAVDNNGATVLNYAKFGGHKNCISFLEKALGIEPIIQTFEEKSIDAIDAAIFPEGNLTPKEFDQYCFIQKQIHKYYQLQKLKSKQTDNSLDIKYWMIEQHVFSSNSEELFEINTGNGNTTYFAISSKITNTIENTYGAEILAKFKSAILNGFVGKEGKAGIKLIDKSLYELKILSSIGGELRLYTSKEYLNSNGNKLIIFENVGNHQTIARIIKRETITTINVEQLLDADVDLHETKQDWNDMGLSGDLHDDC